MLTSRVSRAAIAAAALCMVGLASTASANLLANPGFEDPITSGPGPFVGRWEPFNSPTGAGAGNSADNPRTGLLSLNMNIVATDNAFAGAFQDVAGLTAGSPVEFSAWYATPSNPLDLTFEARIEWRNSVTDTEVSRTPNFTTPPGSAYTQFTLPATVPVGADVARVVFAVQTFTPEPTNTGIVYVDDASFVVVPEPASAGLLAGLVGTFVLRRRR